MLMDTKPIPNLGERCAFILLKASPGSVKKDGTFSSANRNSGSRQDAGTQAEGSECLQRLQTKSWLRPKTAHKNREKGLVGCRDMLNACSECCKTTENSRKMFFVQTEALLPRKPTKQRDRVADARNGLRESTSLRDVPLSGCIPNPARLW